ncbi:MAG: molybdopterin molybdenumtransferase MoeA [Proteobacteria bacterium ST_bin13]|nr:MAG: molybdopterin molybdenumtransferase MoeA [Proteobacteria bacterium ST_bin13]
MMVALLPVANAQDQLLALARPVASESVDLRTAAGRWASADIVAPRSQPVTDLSAMDGYAIRFQDLPGPLRLIGESAAGRPFSGTLSEGETVRIFTGAALPLGADTVMVQEEVAIQDGRVVLAGAGPSATGRNVRPRGLDFGAGQALIARGDRLTPARIALAAMGGQGMITVNRRIRVAIVTTGDELVPPGAPLTGADLPESNGVMLAALLADLPVDVDLTPILPDRLDVISAALAHIKADIIVTIGGASVGDHDLIRPAIDAAGGSINFWRIALRPGKPMLTGMIGETVILGLPGNPVSAFVTAQLFLRPLIAAFGGAHTPVPEPITAILGEALPANDQRQDYLRGSWHEGKVVAAAKQDSSLLLTLSKAAFLIIRPPFAPAAVTGDPVSILPLA